VRGIVEQNHIGGAVVVRKDEINAAASAAHGAIASAIVPAFILAALYKLTKKNKHTKTRRGPTRKRRR
jgi:hypothetical protein